jgi:hypothetical protein
MCRVGIPAKVKSDAHDRQAPISNGNARDLRPVPKARHDPEMENYVENTDPVLAIVAFTVILLAAALAICIVWSQTCGLGAPC